MKVTILGREKPIIIDYDKSISLMEAMLYNGIYFSASCGGRGTCGKCRLQVIEGKLGITASDQAVLSQAELELGYRLACKAYPVQDCTVRINLPDESDFQAVSDYGKLKSQDSPDQPGERPEHSGSNTTPSDSGYAIAIDIGTTTLAFSLISLSQGIILDTDTAVNRQRAYGADVISRIKASVEGKGEVLKKSIRDDLLAGIRSLLQRSGISHSEVCRLAIAGNTTMIHLLMGYSCETLGAYPFTPVNINMIEIPFPELFETAELKVPVVILPGISAFVGGDIVAGLLTCGFDQMDQPGLLIDLGTNGELAIGNKDKILVTSTAAGPAFEGGNISCGIGSIGGAICKVTIAECEAEVETIGHKAPVGICGTGVIELTAELRKAGLMDETGLLTEEYFERGYRVADDSDGNAIMFTQKDVREFQLAKAAIRAGLKTLLRRYGAVYEDIGTVYLAGGFGYRLNLKKAIAIGLLPKELEEKLKVVGNTSLGGATDYLRAASAAGRIEQLLNVSEEIHLSNDMEFQEDFIRYMDF